MMQLTAHEGFTATSTQLAVDVPTGSLLLAGTPGSVTVQNGSATLVSSGQHVHHHTHGDQSQFDFGNRGRPRRSHLR